MVQCTQLSKKSVYGVEIDVKLVEGVDLDAGFFNHFNCLSIYSAVKSNYKCKAIFFWILRKGKYGQ